MQNTVETAPKKIFLGKRKMKELEEAMWAWNGVWISKQTDRKEGQTEKASNSPHKILFRQIHIIDT